MRASKEAAVQAKRDLQWVQERANRLCEPNAGINARDWKELQTRCASLSEFLTAAHKRLPTEAAIERDRKRKR